MKLYIYVHFEGKQLYDSKVEWTLCIWCHHNQRLHAEVIVLLHMQLRSFNFRLAVTI